MAPSRVVPSHHRAVAITLAALAAACAATPSREARSRTSLDRLIAADVACQAAACAPQRCGIVDGGYEQLPTRAADAAACLTDALATCTPARVDGLASGIDSGPFPWTALVAPADPSAPATSPRAACHVVVYTDLRSDFYGSGDVRAEVCGAPGATTRCAPYWTERYAVCREFAEPISMLGESVITSDCTRLPIGWVTADGTGP